MVLYPEIFSMQVNKHDVSVLYFTHWTPYGMCNTILVPTP